MFDELLEDDPWIKEREKRAAEQAELKTLQKTVLAAVQNRFPTLTASVQKSISRIKDQERLQQLIGLIYTAPDEVTARNLLETPSS